MEVGEPPLFAAKEGEPLRAHAAFKVDRHHLKARAALEHDQEPMRRSSRARRFEERDLATMTMRKLVEHRFHQRMSRREEVERLPLHRRFAIEGAEPAASGDDAREIIDRRERSELDVPRLPLGAIDHVEAELPAGFEHHLLVQRLELGRDAREDAGRELGPIAMLVQVLIDAGVKPCAQLARLREDRGEIEFGLARLRGQPERLLDVGE